VEREASLPCSQVPVTFRYPQPDETSPTHLLSIHFNSVLPLLLGLPSGHLHLGLCTKPFLFSPKGTNPPTPQILSSLIWSAEWYLVTVRAQTVNILITQFAAYRWKYNWGRTVERISFFSVLLAALVSILMPQHKVKRCPCTCHEDRGRYSSSHS
jgi:hypothetical protein